MHWPIDIYIDNLVQDSRIPSGMAMEILQICTKLSIWYMCDHSDFNLSYQLLILQQQQKS